jgi:phage terminase small subunit
MARDDRRARFVQEYAKDLNATQAALRSGYSAHTADRQGSRLLKNVEVKTQIDALLAKVTQRNEITIERTVREIARLAYGDPRTMFDAQGNLKPIHELDDDAAACIAGIELETKREDSGDDEDPVAIVTVTTKVKRWDKVRALSQCMEFLGIVKQRVEVSGSDGKPLEITVRRYGDQSAEQLASAAVSGKGVGGIGTGLPPRRPALASPQR